MDERPSAESDGGENGYGDGDSEQHGLVADAGWALILGLDVAARAAKAVDGDAAVGLAAAGAMVAGGGGDVLGCVAGRGSGGADGGDLAALAHGLDRSQSTTPAARGPRMDSRSSLPLRSGAGTGTGP